MSKEGRRSTVCFAALLFTELVLRHLWLGFRPAIRWFIEAGVAGSRSTRPGTVSVEEPGPEINTGPHADVMAMQVQPPARLGASGLVQIHEGFPVWLHLGIR